MPDMQFLQCTKERFFMPDSLKYSCRITNQWQMISDFLQQSWLTIKATAIHKTLILSCIEVVNDIEQVVGDKTGFIETYNKGFIRTCLRLRITKTIDNRYLVASLFCCGGKW